QIVCGSDNCKDVGIKFHGAKDLLGWSGIEENVMAGYSGPSGNGVLANIGFQTLGQEDVLILVKSIEVWLIKSVLSDTVRRAQWISERYRKLNEFPSIHRTVCDTPGNNRRSGGGRAQQYQDRHEDYPCLAGRGF